MQITKYKEYDQGALKAFIDVKMDEWKGFIIRGMKLFEQGGRRWLQFPSEKKEKDGKIEYFPMNSFEERENKDKFQEKVLDLIKAGDYPKEQNEEVPF